MQEEGSGIKLRRIMEEAFGGISSELCEPSENCLRPLYRIEVNEDYVTVIFDMPKARKEDIIVSASEKMLAVEARLVEPVSLMMGGSLQRRVRFDKYARMIRLPVRVNPDKATATFMHGLLRVKFPIEREGKTISIE
jgi:HSP20 family protein